MRLLIATILALYAGELTAQVEPRACAGAVRAVAARSARTADIEWLSTCPTTGPTALASAWQNSDSLAGPDLTPLIETSKRTRDARVYAAVSAVASDRGRRTDLRLASLVVLSAYYRPELAPSLGWLRSAPIGDPAPVGMDANERPGVVPLPESRAADFPLLLFKLAREDTDSSVAEAALRLRQYLAFSDPEHTPVPPNAIHLVAGYGNGPEIARLTDRNGPCPP